ncbi:HECT [Macleaya cordata]|uniref:HECT-type E3 ubiquitin transferase n=1 Tax=Macleaya cordata TaxID=56857 RepID=A0A200PS44_MACCD|nr:HECT [Macleaya cordata]
MEEDIWLPTRLTWKKEHLQLTQAIKDLVFSISRLYSSTTTTTTTTTTGGDYDESSSSSSSSRTDIVARVKDFLRMIPRGNKRKSMDHLEIFELCGAPSALVLLLDSPIKDNKEIGEESIRLFLNPEIGVLPRTTQLQCASIVLFFCIALRERVDNEHLYYSCRETLGSLLKSMGSFAKTLRYFDREEASCLIEALYPFVLELSHKVIQGLELIGESSLSTVSTCFRLSFESDIREFTLFSHHLRKAIEDHVRSKGQSLPLCLEDNFESHPCYLDTIEMFHITFSRLVATIYECMRSMSKYVNADVPWEFNIGWSYYLSVLKELNNISKLYQGAEEILSSNMRSYQYLLDILVMHSKRSDDHRWLLELKNVIDFESRRRWMIKMMFPEVKDDNEKLHKMLIDRSQLLAESFEHIAHANPESLRNGLFMEFQNEVATACPSDRRRFFPNPAKVDPRHLSYFGFCGRLIALALMHKVHVGITFDRVFFLQLAGEVISLEDIRDADPCLYKSCKKILEMDADFMDSDAMGLTFVKEIEEFGSRKIVELCPGGDTMVVNSKNREEYVHLLIQYCFVKSMSEKRRLHKIFFRRLELKDLDGMLLGSDKAICVKDWQAHTVYDDYTETDEQIRWFWKVVEGMSVEQQRELLFFWTSVKYLPVDGFSGLPSPLYIYKTSGSHYRLPSSHTCFYRLSLPHYPSLAVTQQHLFRICQEHVGCSFGFM